MLPGQAGSFRNLKNAFMNDPKSQKGGFWPFTGVQSAYQVLKFNKIIELLSSTVLTGFTGLTSLTVKQLLMLSIWPLGHVTVSS